MSFGSLGRAKFAAPGMEGPLVESAGSGTTNRFAGTSIPRIEV